MQRSSQTGRIAFGRMRPLDPGVSVLTARFQRTKDIGQRCGGALLFLRRLGVGSSMLAHVLAAALILWAPAAAAESVQRDGSAEMLLQVGAGLQNRVALERFESLVGIECSLTMAPAGPVRVAAEGAALFRSLGARFGSVQGRWFIASAGLDGLIDQSLAVGPRLSLSHLSMTATSDQGPSQGQSGVTLAMAGVRATFATPQSSGWRFSAALHVDYAFKGVEFLASRESMLTIDRWIVGTTVGMSLDL